MEKNGVSLKIGWKNWRDYEHHEKIGVFNMAAPPNKIIVLVIHPQPPAPARKDLRSCASARQKAW